MKILPSGKDILLKSIQMHDDPVTECKSPARVELDVKGVDAHDIPRGDIFCSPGSLNLKVATDPIPTGFIKCPYYNGNVTDSVNLSFSIVLAQPIIVT